MTSLCRCGKGHKAGHIRSMTSDNLSSLLFYLTASTTPLPFQISHLQLKHSGFEGLSNLPLSLILSQSWEIILRRKLANQLEAATLGQPQLKQI